MTKILIRWVKVLLVLLVFGSVPAISETRVIPEYYIKAAYLYNFLLFVEWPPEAFEAPPPSPINICILGDDPFEQILTPISKRTAQQRRILLHHLNINDNLRHCQVIFINTSEQQHLKEILQRTQSSHLLTVSDIPEFAHQGGMVGFVLKEGNVRLEINLEAMQSSGLKASSKLLEVAESIVGGQQEDK